MHERCMDNDGRGKFFETSLNQWYMHRLSKTLLKLFVCFRSRNFVDHLFALLTKSCQTNTNLHIPHQLRSIVKEGSSNLDKVLSILFTLAVLINQSVSNFTTWYKRSVHIAHGYVCICGSVEPHNNDIVVGQLKANTNTEKEESWKSKPAQ